MQNWVQSENFKKICTESKYFMYFFLLEFVTKMISFSFLLLSMWGTVRFWLLSNIDNWFCQVCFRIMGRVTTSKTMQRKKVFCIAFFFLVESVTCLTTMIVYAINVIYKKIKGFLKSTTDWLMSISKFWSRQNYPKKGLFDTVYFSW